MIAVLQGLPIEPLTPEREQALFLAGDTESVVLHALTPAFNYLHNVRSKGMSLPNGEVLSICYAALSRSIKTFKPGLQTFLNYSKPFLRGELCKHWREKNVVKDAFRHETQVETEFPKPLADDHVDPVFDHWKEVWEQVEPVIRKALTPIEIRVLELRFKLSYTLEAAGKEIGKSRERVRQVEAKALQKLRAALSNRAEL